MLDNESFTFKGRESINVNSLFKKIKNTFTYEFWVKPLSKHSIDRENTSGISGVKGQRFVVFPGHGEINGEAGVGISVGTNGISVYEHTNYHLPALLVFKCSIIEPVHIAVAIKNKTPYLYINGEFKKAGKRSKMNTLYPSGTFGGLNPYGYFIGTVDDLRIWDYVRTEDQIIGEMHDRLTGQEDGLFLYWNSKKDREIFINDLGNSEQNDKKWSSIPISRSSNTIVLISGSSAYNATCYFGYELEKAFKLLGYDVILLENANGLAGIVKDRNVLFIIGMNGHGFSQISREVYLNKLSVPYFAYLVDHPLYHIDTFDFNRSARNLIISCVDQTHVDYLNNYFTGNFSKVFIPHGSALSITKPPIIPIKDRPIEILFAGSFISPDECRKHWISDSLYGAILDEIVENTIYQSNETLIEITKNTFLNKGIKFDYPKNKRLKDLLFQADYYIRGRRRKEILESLIKLPIEIYNNHWSYLESMGGNAKVFNEINYDEFQKKMLQSKIVLNVLPNLTYGGHDRIFTSMLAGSVSLTDNNAYLNSCFSDKENILMYNFKDADLADKLEQILRNDEELQMIADKGNMIAQEKHTWVNRAVQIINHVQQYLTAST